MAKMLPGWELLKADRLMLVVASGLAIALVINQWLAMQQRHRDSVRQADLYSIQLAVQKYYALKGYYPSSLRNLPGLTDKTCSDPKFGGNCITPGYTYTPLAQDAKSTCDNSRVFCRNYQLISSRMETTSPLVLASF